MLHLPQPIVPLIQLMLKRRKGTKSLTIRLDHSSDGRKTGNRKTKLNIHNLYVYIKGVKNKKIALKNLLTHFQAGILLENYIPRKKFQIFNLFHMKLGL